MIRSRKMLKKVGDRRHPCLTPTVALNHSEPSDIDKCKPRNEASVSETLALFNRSSEGQT